MPFKKGHKLGQGRPKGSKNKDSFGKTRIKEYFENGGLEMLLADIEELEAKDKVNAKIKLIEYYLPKQKEVNNTHDIKNNILEVNFTKKSVPPITSENDLFDDD
jgi:hypothetical protein